MNMITEWRYFAILLLAYTQNRKVQGVPQSEAAGKTDQEEEKKEKHYRVQNKQTHAREAHRPAPSSPIEVITC